MWTFRPSVLHDLKWRTANDRRAEARTKNGGGAEVRGTHSGSRLPASNRQRKGPPHERLSRHRHRHLRHQNPGDRRAGPNPGPAMETYPCYVPKPLWSEQDPDDWWQGHVEIGPPGGGQGRAEASRRQGDRPIRPDARLGVPRQARPGDSPGDPLERSADLGRVPRRWKSGSAAAKS